MSGVPRLQAGASELAVRAGVAGTVLWRVVARSGHGEPSGVRFTANGGTQVGGPQANGA